MENSLGVEVFWTQIAYLRDRGVSIKTREKISLLDWFFCIWKIVFFLEFEEVI